MITLGWTPPSPALHNLWMAPLGEQTDKQTDRQTSPNVLSPCYAVDKMLNYKYI